MSDESIMCVMCHRPFIWSGGEQEYYRQHGLERPKHCPECLARRRAEARPGMRGETLPAAGNSGSSAGRRGEVRSAQTKLDFGAATLLPALALAALLAFAFPSLLDVPKSWLISITPVTLAAFGYDKAIAGTGRPRVPEDVLLALVAAGGTLGGLLGMLLFRHKISRDKQVFRLKLWIIVAAQVAVAALVGLVRFLF